MLELVLQIVRKRNRGERNFQANSSRGLPDRTDFLMRKLVKSVIGGSRSTSSFQNTNSV